MKLFDEIKRDDCGAATYSEPKFNYLNRSDRPAFYNIRKVLEDWFSRYPEKNRLELRGRFRSTHDMQHRSAFFELLLHELMLRLGCHVEIHPSVAGSTRTPDFRVSSDTDGPFLLEAVVVSGESHQQTSAKAMTNKVYDVLNRLESPNFFIGIDPSRSSESPPPARKIRAFLKQRLVALDPDQIARDFKSRGFDALPRWRYSFEGWEIDFFPIPKSPELRGKPGVRPVGMESDGPDWVDSRTPLRDAILEKARKYGKPELPFVVAVNSLADHLDRTDALEALFGRKKFIYTQTREGIVRPKPQRVPDGVWTSPGGPRYTRLTSVLLMAQLLPWSLCHCQVCLYHNPWAEKGLDSQLDRLPRMTPIGDRPSWVDSESLSAIFGLPRDWPGKD